MMASGTIKEGALSHPKGVYIDSEEETDTPPPQTSPLTADDISRREHETRFPRNLRHSSRLLMGDLIMVTLRTSRAGGALRAICASEHSQSVQKMKRSSR
ncbi:hypothetical protein Tco_0916770 [Tanacetum coccineum]